MHFTLLDVAIVAIYMVISAGAGSWIGRRQRTTTDYFLADRQMPWLAAAFSIVATETSVLTFISVPAVSYTRDMTFLQITFGYFTGRLLVAWIMVPRYFEGKLTTAYHFLETRFGSRMRKTASLTFMVTRILADGVRLFATAIPLALIIKGSGLLAELSDTEFYALSIVLIGLFTIFYTYVGGIRSVIWMDVVQMLVYMAGALLAAAIIINDLPGGMAQVLEFGREHGKLRWFYLGFDLPFSQFIQQPYTFFTATVAGAIFSLASHGTDQLIVQRLLTCRNQRDAQKAISLSGVMIVLQFLLFLFVGVLLFTFYQGASVAQLGLTRADGIFPKFIVEQMPPGISGLVVAALFAAAMSTLSSTLSSLASATVMDIYKPLFGRHLSEQTLLKRSRMVTLMWGIILIGVAVAFIGLKGTVVEVALGIASYTYGGLLGAFLLGIINPRARQRDAIIGFITALVTMTFFIQSVQIAWPLYTVVGSIAAIAVGSLAARLLPEPSHEL